jgi:hypothetical protein
VRVSVDMPEPGAARLVREKLPVIPLGSPLRLRLMAALKALFADVVRVRAAFEPGATLLEVGETVNV